MTVLVLPWVLTVAHRRAVDRVRSAQAADRERRVAAASCASAFDEAAGQVGGRLVRERKWVRRGLRTPTELRRESSGTVGTRVRDALIRMRDCLGVGT
ncbi:hypothetical protein ACFV6F_04400 [Kitasatospora phosalacinea]|uniref:hypothetical protein n=1 Tax=Kitasatospora phosalacinea TaxID=2065 RepID=UPI003648E0F3